MNCLKRSQYLHTSCSTTFFLSKLECKHTPKPDKSAGIKGIASFKKQSKYQTDRVLVLFCIILPKCKFSLNDRVNPPRRQNVQPRRTDQEVYYGNHSRAPSPSKIPLNIPRDAKHSLSRLSTHCLISPYKMASTLTSLIPQTPGLLPQWLLFVRPNLQHAAQPPQWSTHNMS